MLSEFAIWIHLEYESKHITKNWVAHTGRRVLLCQLKDKFS